MTEPVTFGLVKGHDEWGTEVATYVSYMCRYEGTYTLAKRGVPEVQGANGRMFLQGSISKPPNVGDVVYVAGKIHRVLLITPMKDRASVLRHYELTLGEYK